MKYSAETLKGMAEIVVVDRASGGENSLFLILAIARNLGLNANDVLDRIKGLAS